VNGVGAGAEIKRGEAGRDHHPDSDDADRLVECSGSGRRLKQASQPEQLDKHARLDP
jgi:hypothetical protein